MSDDVLPFPSLERLHERHYGLSEAVAKYYAEGAAICMQRCHTAPKSIAISEDGELARDYLASWETPSNRQLVAWGNRDDATRDAGYGVIIAAAEAYLGK